MLQCHFDQLLRRVLAPALSPLDELAACHLLFIATSEARRQGGPLQPAIMHALGATHRRAFGATHHHN